MDNAPFIKGEQVIIVDDIFYISQHEGFNKGRKVKITGMKKGRVPGLYFCTIELNGEEVDGLTARRFRKAVVSNVDRVRERRRQIAHGL